MILLKRDSLLFTIEHIFSMCFSHVRWQSRVTPSSLACSTCSINLNDIVSAIDNQSYIILLLLDLSAAFDTVDHKILPQKLSCLFGINGKALRWFKSHLENRK